MLRIRKYPLDRKPAWISAGVFLALLIISGVRSIGNDPQERTLDPAEQEMADLQSSFGDIKWSSTGLSALLPDTKSHKGLIETDSEDKFFAYVADVSPEDFKDYSQACVEAGFNVGTDQGDTYLAGDNEEYVSIDLTYGKTIGDVMEVALYAPTKDEIALMEKEKEEAEAAEKKAVEEAEATKSAGEEKAKTEAEAQAAEEEAKKAEEAQKAETPQNAGDEKQKEAAAVAEATRSVPTEQETAEASVLAVAGNEVAAAATQTAQETNNAVSDDTPSEGTSSLQGTGEAVDTGSSSSSGTAAGGSGGGGTGNGSNFDTYDNAAQQQTSAAYVLNTDKMKIHKPSCNDVKKIAPQNYATSNESISDLEARGYTRCGHCHPY